MVLEKWNSWWATGRVEEELLGIKRNKGIFFETEHIKDVIGVRRSGKTTYIMEIINTLLKEGINPKEIVFINFDDPQIKSKNLEEINELIFTTRPEVKYLFVDEVQEKKGWEEWIRMNYDLKNFKQIYVTGSSSSLISKEIGRTLTGRHITINFTPFSFYEYVNFHLGGGIDYEKIKYNQYKIKNLFNNYLISGGFPETFNKSDTIKHIILNNIYTDILSRDIAARYNINYDKLEIISSYLLNNIKNEYSYKSVSRKLNIAYETVEKYVEYLKDSFLFYELQRFDYKLSQQYRKNKKIYTVDTGLFSIVSFKFSENRGKLLENIVFLELIRREKEIYYYKEKNECDFVIKEGLDIVQAIQVSESLKNNNTKKREIEGLLDACIKYNLKEGLILTEDEEGEEMREVSLESGEGSIESREKRGGRREKFRKVKIIIKPMWKWLLE